MTRRQPERIVPHLVDTPGDRLTRCGLRADWCANAWARWAQAHIDGHGTQFCPACTEGLDLTAIDKRNDGNP